MVLVELVGMHMHELHFLPGLADFLLFMFKYLCCDMNFRFIFQFLANTAALFLSRTLN